MKKIVAIVVVLSLFLGVMGCQIAGVPQFWTSIAYGAEYGNWTPNMTVKLEGSIMAVFYVKADELVLFTCVDGVIVDNGDGTWDIYGYGVEAHGVSQALVAYGLYKWQAVDTSTPVYLSELGLQAITWEDLPQSLHIAALESVAMVSGSPRANVTRLYMGQEFMITNCRVSLQAYIAYGGGNITLRNHAYGLGASQNANCFVLVYFISETPFDSEVSIPVVLDKVIK